MNLLKQVGPEWVLRLSLGALYLYSGFDLYSNPNAWHWAIPQWLKELLLQFTTLNIYIKLQGLSELVMGAVFLLWFLRPWLVKIVALISVFEMAGILYFDLVPFSATNFRITFRDIAILGASAAVFLILSGRKKTSLGAKEAVPSPLQGGTVPQEVLDYIAHCVREGFSEDQIRQELDRAGWSPPAVTQAFDATLHRRSGLPEMLRGKYSVASHLPVTKNETTRNPVRKYLAPLVWFMVIVFLVGDGFLLYRLFTKQKLGTPSVTVPLPGPAPQFSTSTPGTSTPPTGATSTPIVRPAVREITVTAKKNMWNFSPDVIEVNQGDTLKLTVVNEDDYDHGFAIDEFGINKIMPALKTIVVEFKVTKAGDFLFYCSVVCGEGVVNGKTRGHFDQVGRLHVRSLISETR